MELHSDFTQRAIVHAAKLPWVASPIAGVERRMLDRVGGEVARATTVVRYATDSMVSAHVHKRRGEFFVVDGAFHEGDEAFEPQSWLRLPPGARLKALSGPEGCLVWVKAGHLAHPQTVPGAPRAPATRDPR